MEAEDWQVESRLCDAVFGILVASYRAPLQTGQEQGHSFSISFLEAWRLIIRPPRRRYGAKSLGPPQLQVLLPSEREKRLSRPLERRDLELTNARGHQLKCSHFVSYNRDTARTPCVVFCHGSSSCRVDVFQIMPYLFEARPCI